MIWKLAIFWTFNVIFACIAVRISARLPVFTARGKPSTWFPRGRLVEQSRQDKTQKRRQKARTEKENPPATAAAHYGLSTATSVHEHEYVVLVTMSNSSKCQFCRRRSIYEIFTFETDQNVSFIAKYVVENCNNVLQTWHGSFRSIFGNYKILSNLIT